MLETILTHLHNWFPLRDGKHSGTFAIVSGVPDVGFLQPGQYYRIRGSAFNDGLHQFVKEDALHDEKFSGEIWALAVPDSVLALADEIAAWREKNPETDKISESFGGYSYTRSAASGNGTAAGGWQTAFAARLAPYRRVHDD